jgi:CheY-like chemotaxis protein
LSYEAILDELGENLIKASSATEALEQLLKRDIAIILIDVCMPDLDGFQLASMIREHPRFQSIAIIFVSAVQVTNPDLLRGYGLGAVDYVPVIIHRLKFEEVVSKTADKARAAREKAETELADLQSRMTPLQTEINRLTRQFWVTKEQVKCKKYDLSASRYRQVEQDEEFYEQPRVTLERLARLEAVAAGEVAVLKERLAKP